MSRSTVGTSDQGGPPGFAARRQEREGPAGFAEMDMGRHPGHHLFAVDQLVFDDERILGVDEQVVKIQDALQEPFAVTISGGDMPDVIRRDDLLERGDVSRGVSFLVPDMAYPSERKLNRDRWINVEADRPDSVPKKIVAPKIRSNADTSRRYSLPPLKDRTYRAVQLLTRTARFDFVAGRPVSPRRWEQDDPAQMADRTVGDQ